MIGEILIGVLGNAAYDILKRVLKKVFNNEDSETVKAFLQAFDRATSRLFNQYRDTIGTPESSFLSKESNWTLICTCIYYSSEKMAPQSIDISGLGVDKQIVIPAIRDFIKILEEEMHKEPQLDKILEEKEHIRQTKEIKLLLEQVLQTLSQKEQDDTVALTIERQQREFSDSISPGLISNRLIHREETNGCLTAVKENKFVIVHGAAGYGKSGVLYELTNMLLDEGIIFLPVRLDRRTPEKNPNQFGIDMGFSKSPVSCLVSHAGSRQCVLILDQLDAIRWTSKHSSNALDICKELIREVQLYQQSGVSISVVLSCRTFDLENDPEIHNWLNNKGPWEFSKIPIGLLSEPCVREIVGEPIYSMTERQRSILTNPQNLSIWVALNEQGAPPLFQSAIELIREFWKNRRSKLEDLGITANDINSVLNCLVNWLENNGQVSAPVRLLSDCSIKTIDAFKSFGIIQEQNCKITFCHQSVDSTLNWRMIR